MGSCTLICLGCRTVRSDENQDGGEGAEGHRNRKEGARVLQYGEWIQFATANKRLQETAMLGNVRSARSVRSVCS